MKKLALIITTLLFTIHFSPASAQWVYVGQPGLNQPGENPSVSGGFCTVSMQVNPITYQPYVAYIDSIEEGKVIVKKFDGAIWTKVDTSVSPGKSQWTSLAFHPVTGEPYVAYSDYLNGEKATVKKYNGSAWSFVGSAGFSDGGAFFVQIKFNLQSNEPYVVYSDVHQGGKCTVMRFDNTNWVPVGQAGFSNEVAILPKIATTPSGNLIYVVFRDNATGHLKCQKYDGNSWTYVGNIGYTANTASLCIDPATSDPFISFNLGIGPYVLKFNGSSWVAVGNFNLTISGGNETYLTFHPFTHEPYIFYTDATQQARATVKKFDGFNWATVGSAGFTLTPICLSADFNLQTNEPYVAFVPAFNTVSISSKVTVMKYDKYSGVEINLSNKPRVYPNPTAGSITIDIGKQHQNFHVEIRNTIGELIQTVQCNTQKAHINMPESMGLYFLTIITASSERNTVAITKE